MNHAHLSDLLERVEGASERSPELNEALSLTFKLGKHHLGSGEGLVSTEEDWGWVDLTGSIDDALWLVERKLPGWSWSVRKSGFGDPVEAELWNPRKAPGAANSFRATLPHGHAPLAILAALLRALISHTPEEEGNG